MNLTDWKNKFKSPINHTKRDAVILRSIVSGASYASAAAFAGLSASRARIVAVRLAVRLVREERRENPATPLQFTFTQEEFVSQPGLWKARLDKHLGAIERSFSDA